MYNQQVHQAKWNSKYTWLIKKKAKKKKEKRKKNQLNKWKTNSKMVKLNPNIPVIDL